MRERLVMVALAFSSLPACGLFVNTPMVSPESECHSNLRAVAVAEQVFFMDQTRYSPDFREIGFTPDRGRRYLYVSEVAMQGTSIAADRTTETTRSLVEKIPLSLWLEVGITPSSYTVLCVANLDDDPDPDVWTVSSRPTIDVDGVTIAPGRPAHRRRDR